MKTLLLALTFPLLFASCGVLRPVKDKSVTHILDATIPDRPITGATPAVALSRPSLPSYLDRQELVSRAGDGQLKMNAYHLWGEPLDAAISRILATNLGRLENSLNIQPVENFITMDYQTLLEIRVSRFEPDVSGQMVLDCTWKLQPVAGRLAQIHSFLTVVPISVQGDEKSPGVLTGRVVAMNEALARLSREIAKSL
jgi:uncharacterized lipoprotein YmbA